MASKTENGKMAFIVDIEKTSSIEEQNQMVLVDAKTHTCQTLCTVQTASSGLTI